MYYMLFLYKKNDNEGGMVQRHKEINLHWSMVKINSTSIWVKSQNIVVLFIDSINNLSWFIFFFFWFFFLKKKNSYARVLRETMNDSIVNNWFIPVRERFLYFYTYICMIIIIFWIFRIRPYIALDLPVYSYPSWHLSTDKVNSIF